MLTFSVWFQRFVTVAALRKKVYRKMYSRLPAVSRALLYLEIRYIIQVHTMRLFPISEGFVVLGVPWIRRFVISTVSVHPKIGNI